MFKIQLDRSAFPHRMCLVYQSGSGWCSTSLRFTRTACDAAATQSNFIYVHAFSRTFRGSADARQVKCDMTMSTSSPRSWSVPNCCSALEGRGTESSFRSWLGRSAGVRFPFLMKRWLLCVLSGFFFLFFLLSMKCDGLFYPIHGLACSLSPNLLAERMIKWPLSRASVY